MKIRFGKPGSGRVHLVCSIKESLRINTLVRQHITSRAKRVTRDERVWFSFPRQTLPLLLDIFASAERSPAVQRWEDHREEKIWKDVDPNIEVPGFRGELYPFQRRGVALMASRRAFFLHDDMGLGKTIQALCAVAVKETYPAIVVCPNSVKHVWAQEIEDHFPDISCTVVQGGPEERTAQIESGTDVVVVNYEALRLHPEIANVEWATGIADEHHRLKNTQAKQTRAFHEIQADYKLLLSGTPLLNGRLEELWSPLHWAYPKKFKGDMRVAQPDWLFRKKYCIVVRGQVVGYRRVAELRTALHSRSLRRRKEEVLPELPERIYSVRKVEMTKEQRRIYNDIKNEMLIWLEDGTPKRILDVRAKITRLKQACFSPELYEGSHVSAKLNELKELVREITESGHKAIIFSQWAKATRIIKREFSGYEYSYVDGSVPPGKRKPGESFKPGTRGYEIERFQNDPDRVLYIGTIGANREGITLTAANYVIFTDLDWVPAYNDQAADRAHRIGQKNTVNVIELQAVETIEEKIGLLLQRKSEMNSLIVDRKPITSVSAPGLHTLARYL